jgi:hypothetical protein
VPNSAKDALIFGLPYPLKRRARIEHAPASGTQNVPRHIENAESRTVQKSCNHIFFIESMPGGKGESVNTAKIAVRAVPDELFDRTHRFRFRRLSQSIEESVGFAAKFHGNGKLIPPDTLAVWLGKTKSKSN